MTVDLMAAVAGPYTAPAAAPTLPRTPTPTAAATAPIPVPQAPAPGPAPSPAAPTPAAAAPTPAPEPPRPAPATWWRVELPNTDGARHAYCGRCHAQIPKFLIVHSEQLERDDGELVSCEGCGQSPDLTATTITVLDHILTAVNDGEDYPTEHLGRSATAACLEHARECVLLCAAARGTLDV